MNRLKILDKLGEAGVFDVAKILHNHYRQVSTKRINDLILQLDSVDQAIIVLNGHKEDNVNINDAVYLILKYREQNGDRP